MTQLPIAIIGGGPIGLAAASHLVQRGETPLILEVGTQVGDNMLKWAHVRMFSPWRYVVDPVAVDFLTATGWQMPDPEGLPTGGEFVRDYLQPLAELPQLAPHIHLDSRVISVARWGYDKTKTVGREEAPFVLHVAHSDGSEAQFFAKAVIDASGTYANPNPLGGSGVPASGEKGLAAQIFYGIPDVLGKDRARYANKRVMVVGSGHSAFNALLDLAANESVPEITWVIRRSNLRQLYGGGASDQLPARASLGQRLRHVVESGRVNLVNGFRIERLTPTADGIVVTSNSDELAPVDEIIVTTGLRPDLSIEQELRLAIDPTIESAADLATHIDPNIHSCGSVPPHGVDMLGHPEKDFYIIGMKSYGRAPNFLLLTGYEQARSVVAALVGDWESAREVHLVLPETGVCSSDNGEGGCCTPAPANAEIELVASSGGCCASVSAEASGGCCQISQPDASVISTPVANVQFFDSITLKG